MKLIDLKPGMIVVADAGFTCVTAGEHVVQQNGAGDLFIECNDGEHLLDGQVGDDGELIGLSEPTARPILVHLTKKELEVLRDIFGVVSDDHTEQGAVAEKLHPVVTEILASPVSVAE